MNALFAKAGNEKISALKKPGLGNPALGGVFKSVYLCQGRTAANNSNQNLNKVHNVLLSLMERPDEPLEDFLREDLYTSPKFRIKPAQAESMLLLRYGDDMQPINRSMIGSPQDLISYKLE